jgi:hypothetical protein
MDCLTGWLALCHGMQCFLGSTAFFFFVFLHCTEDRRVRLDRNTDGQKSALFLSPFEARRTRIQKRRLTNYIDRERRSNKM